MKLDSCAVVANFFDRFLDVDDFAVNAETEFFESFSNLDAVDRAEDSACGACLGTDCELDVFELGCKFFGVGLDLASL